MREQKIVTIKDKEYTITQLDGRTGLRLLKKVQAIVTPAVFGASRVGGEEGGVDIAKLLLDISEKFEDFDEDEIFKSVAVSLNWTEDKVANTFTGGNLSGLVKLFFEIIMFNFNDVFQELGFDLQGMMTELSAPQE